MGDFVDQWLAANPTYDYVHCNCQKFSVDLSLFLLGPTNTEGFEPGLHTFPLPCEKMVHKECRDILLKLPVLDQWKVLPTEWLRTNFQLLPQMNEKRGYTNYPQRAPPCRK